jgi:hypothetical protein
VCRLPQNPCVSAKPSLLLQTSKKWPRIISRSSSRSSPNPCHNASNYTIDSEWQRNGCGWTLHSWKDCIFPCTFSFKSVVTHHAAPCRLRTLVDVTHHSGLCRISRRSRSLQTAQKEGSSPAVIPRLTISVAVTVTAKVGTEGATKFFLFWNVFGEL